MDGSGRGEAIHEDQGQMKGLNISARPGKREREIRSLERKIFVMGWHMSLRTNAGCRDKCIGDWCGLSRPGEKYRERWEKALSTNGIDLWICYVSHWPYELPLPPPCISLASRPSAFPASRCERCIFQLPISYLGTQWQSVPLAYGALKACSNGHLRPKYLLFLD